MAVGVRRGIIPVTTRSRFDIVNVTSLVNSWLAKAGGEGGILNIHVPHTTAAILINEAEEGLLHDIVSLMRELTRPDADWQHNRIDNNAHAHLGNVLVGPGVTVPVAGGRLLLGTWQSVLLLEMDGPRRRKIILTFIGELRG